MSLSDGCKQVIYHLTGYFLQETDGSTITIKSLSIAFYKS